VRITNIRHHPALIALRQGRYNRGADFSGLIETP
jgi:hypothetical protein